ncbi:Crp/Fnr family transcriptional regulator [Paraflavisolibacter sp. H34]|uniref:Crp/Fnr family transcriptional regulator n=1 Tax=Huijunlia imazamoxiresistens TaxID=3127457 RepID=UPI003019DBD6
MEQLLKIMSSIYPISDEVKERFANAWTPIEFAKKQFILREGHICRNIYFIEQGLARCFYVKGTTEVCTWFMMEGDLMISVESFFQQTKAKESIQALEDCRMYYISHHDLMALYHEFKELNFIGRTLTEKYYILCEQRLYSIRMMKAQESYAYLMNHFPEIIRRVPCKYIASYLGISEEYLSYIKRQAPIVKVS